MSWAKLDDKFYTHPKVARMDHRMLPAVGLYCLALTWCADQLTDGFIPEHQVARLAGPVGKLKVSLPGLIAALLEAGLWEQTEGGYLIHDYLEYNATRETVLAEREAAKFRMKASRVQKKFARTSDEQPENNGRTSAEVQALPYPYVPTEHKEEQASPFATPEEKAMYLEFAERQRAEDEARGIHRGC